MKIVLSLLISFTAISFALNAQQNHFVFIQSETRQPFNITINNKVYSSTASGYVIVPKILAGTYSISVGFGGNVIPDQSFNIEVLQKDLGYTLKNVDQKGWALLNLQTFENIYAANIFQQSLVVSANTSNVTKPPANVPERTFQPEVNSPVSKDLKNEIDTMGSMEGRPLPVTNSGTSDNGKIKKEVTETPALQSSKEPVKEEVVINEKKIEEPQSIPKNETRTNQSVSNNLLVKSTITKISELKGGEAIYITFVDESANQSDTINVLIPDNISQAAKGEKPAIKSELKFLDIKSPPSKDSTQPVASSKTADKVSPAGKSLNNPIFSRCSTSASNDDFLKLRKKMAAATDNDGMISEAKKSFKGMCFNTDQIKNLAYLFLTDQSRYQFFDASYPAVSDPANFNSLAVMLSDAYYINRFRAMLVD